MLTIKDYIDDINVLDMTEERAVTKAYEIFEESGDNAAMKLHYIAYNIDWSNPNRYSAELYDTLGTLIAIKQKQI